MAPLDHMRQSPNLSQEASYPFWYPPCSTDLVAGRNPRPWRDIAIWACPPLPEPSIPARNRSALAACRLCLPPDRRPSVRPRKPRVWPHIFTIRLLYTDFLRSLCKRPKSRWWITAKKYRMSCDSYNFLPNLYDSNGENTQISFHIHK